MYDIAIYNVNIPDFENLKFFKSNVYLKDGKIDKITDEKLEAKKKIDGDSKILSPGLIDCHCHIESSYMIPQNFGKVLAKFGTLYAVADPHEIANVKSAKGVKFFIENAKKSPIKILFAIPSTVPASDFNTSGGKIGVEEVEELIDLPQVVGLGEMMNVPALVNNDEKFLKMMEIAKSRGKRVNGHMPSLPRDILMKLRDLGIEDDHESYHYEELKMKLELGFKVFIREGSPEQTHIEAYKIINEYPNSVMFCTDDKTTEDILSRGHINENLKKAIRAGINPVLALKIASYNGLKYYGLDEYSEVKEGNVANLVLFNDEFNPEIVFINGKIYEEREDEVIIEDEFLNTINLDVQDTVPQVPLKKVVMFVRDGSLITERIDLDKELEKPDLEKDILKMVLYERYGNNRKSATWIKGFGLKKGAIATSLSHDCHNILAVGVDDESILKVVNEIIRNQGGQALFDGEKIYYLPLRVCGVVSRLDYEKLAENVKKLKEKARQLGSNLHDPFAMLSFMALEVIGHIKLTDRGLFDVDKFEYVKEVG